MTIMQTYQGVVRRGKIQIKPPIQLPEGSEVYVVVASPETPQTAAALYVNPNRPAMQREEAAFQALLPELLTSYPDQYVALHGGQVVDSDADKVALVMRLDQAYPDTVVLVKKVTAEPERALRMPSPRLRGTA